MFRSGLHFIQRPEAVTHHTCYLTGEEIRVGGCYLVLWTWSVCSRGRIQKVESSPPKTTATDLPLWHREQEKQGLRKTNALWWDSVKFTVALIKIISRSWYPNWLMFIWKPSHSQYPEATAWPWEQGTLIKVLFQPQCGTNSSSQHHNESRL